MKLMDRQLEPGMDSFICSGCGIKKHLPKKSPERLAKEEQFSKLDKERASFEGIIAENQASLKPAPKIKEEPKEEKTHALDIKEIVRGEQKSATKDSSIKIKNLSKEIKLLSEHINELKAEIELKDIEIRELKKDSKSYLEILLKNLAELKNSFNTKIKEIEAQITNLDRK